MLVLFQSIRYQLFSGNTKPKQKMVSTFIEHQSLKKKMASNSSNVPLRFEFLINKS